MPGTSGATAGQQTATRNTHLLINEAGGNNNYGLGSIIQNSSSNTQAREQRDRSADRANIDKNNSRKDTNYLRASQEKDALDNFLSPSIPPVQQMQI